MVIIKSTQNGISEYLLIRAIAHAIEGLRVFYVLPTFELVKRFVDERYTKSVQNTNYYRLLVREVKKEMDIKQTESVKSKDIGRGNIAFVNSGSSVGFTEYPADEVIIDELDKCDPVNIEMAWERLSTSTYRRQIKISNPTYKNTGIDVEYKNTDRMKWYIKCDKCNNQLTLDWFKHIVKQTDDKRYIIRDPDWTWNSKNDINAICDKCNKPIDRNKSGEWVATKTNIKRGYHLTKMFTGTVTIVELLDRFIKGQTNDVKLQRFYNADLGEAYTAQGSQLTREMIIECVRNYKIGKDEGIILAGIDVGKMYNIVLKKMTDTGTFKTIYVGKVRETIELLAILKNYKVTIGVIDAMPETREVKKIAQQFKMMFLCYFGNVKNDRIDIVNKVLTVQRTPALDAVKEAILTKTVQYPINIINDNEFLDQMTSSIRIYNPDRKIYGQQGAYEWIEGDKQDHYFLATAYCLIARRLLILLKR